MTRSPRRPAARRSLRPAVLLLGCALLGAPTASQGDPVAQEEVDRAGHQRMIDALAKVHAARNRQNSYLGTKPLDRALALLAKTDERTPAKTVARLRYDIGQNLLRLGRNDEAIAELLESHRILEAFPRDDWPPFADKLPYSIAVANMRAGENANCVARHTAQSCILPIGEDGVHVDQTGSREAIKWFRSALAHADGDRALELSARWLLNIAAMTVGEWPDGLSEDERIGPEILDPPADFPRFVDRAVDLGVNAFDLCGGAITDDLDGDGLVDILSSTWDTDGQLRFYHNAGDGTFEERTEEAGIVGIFGGLNMVSADYDNDGDVDVLVLRGAWVFGRGGEVPNSLLRNDGGRFVDVTFAVGLAEVGRPTQTAGWADYDLDGDLDLFIGNEARQDEAHPCQLFRNDGGHFVDVAEEAGVTNGFFTKGVTWGDFDNDRYPDLFLSNLSSPNRLYRNRGDGTFEDVASDAKVGWPLKSFPTWFWDFDNDGNLDLYVSSYDQGEFGEGYRLAPVVASYLGEDFERFGAEAPRLYKGDGKGGFVDVAEECGVARVTLPMGANFADVDNDGFLDFYLGTGYPFYDGLIPNVMYRNVGGVRFEDVTAAGGVGHLQKGHGVAFADFDEDGDVDLFEQIGGAYPGDGFGNVLFENPGTTNRFLKVRLVGVESNRMGVGCRIRAFVPTGGEGDERERMVHREAGTGGSFGCGSLVQHLGLGATDGPVRLEVFWPRTGNTQVFEDVPVDATVVVTEGEDELEVLERQAFRLGG